MLTNLAAYITTAFVLTVALTLYLFILAVKNKALTFLILLLWLSLTGVLSFKGIFENTSVFPPRLALIMLPAFAFIILLLATKRKRSFTDNLDLKRLTLLHVVRIPVEAILFLLASHKFIPELLTFAGRNFDILSGITAPIMYFAAFRSSQLTHRRLLLAWKFICLALLLNIAICI